MSLDVSLIVDGECVFDANITHNLGKMAAEAGIYQYLWRPEEIGATVAADITEGLRVGLHALVERPTHFEQFDSPNGWGKYKHFVPFVSKYLEACVMHPSAVLHISR